MVCHIRLAGLAIVALLMPSIVAAQSPPPTKVPVVPKVDQLDPNACARSDTQTTVGKGGDAQIHRPDGKDDLSEKLARSGGVICPPEHVDPEIRVRGCLTVFASASYIAPIPALCFGMAG